MVRSLLYVSRSRLGFPDDAFQLDDIVQCALSRNAGLAVTGALMSTEAAFAQVLEGPVASIDELMDSIRRDERHTEITIVSDIILPERRFGRWALAYAGPATYVSGLVEPLIRTPDDRTEIKEAQLVRFMRDLTSRPQ